jgi:hypothetical protein
MAVFTVCPSATSFERYDEYQFIKQSEPVGIQYAGRDEWRSTSGMGFEDAAGCHVQTRKPFSSRRWATPAWAINTHDLQKIIVEYLLNRVGGKRIREQVQGMSLAEQLRHAEKSLHDRLPALEKTVGDLCDEFVMLKKTGSSPARLRKLESLISGHDTTLVINRSAGRIVAAVIYRYYHLGEDSPAIASATGMRPPGVRQMLRKVWLAARALGFPEPERVAAVNTSTGRRIDEAWRAQKRQAKADARQRRLQEREARRNQRLLEVAARDAEKFERRKRALLPGSGSLRERRIAAGLCPRCGKTPCVKGHCEECKAYLRRYRNSRQ